MYVQTIYWQDFTLAELSGEREIELTKNSWGLATLKHDKCLATSPSESDVSNKHLMVLVHLTTHSNEPSSEFRELVQILCN